jgi:putative iron-regulated protein
MLKKYATALLASAALTWAVAAVPAQADMRQDVVQTYGNVALAMYEDALLAAKDLRSAVQALIAQPTEANLAAARKAWLIARKPYQQTEGFRFGNPVVDDWEGRVNAWPLDEGLIDYVDTSKYGTESDENLLYTANVIANSSLMIGGQPVDATTITPALLRDHLQEADGNEANVAIGYHAIEFLLWGQDLNGTGPGAGTRPASDYDPVACTGGNCARRSAYLLSAAELLVSDLEEIVAAWGENGAARGDLDKAGTDGALVAMLTGLGSLSYGELAGERMQLGLLLHDPEEEHDCFSDNTYNSHYYDQLGMMTIYQGSYTRSSGAVVSGPSLDALVAAKDAKLAESVRAAFADTKAKMEVMVQKGESGMAYDQMLAEGNAEGNAILQAVIDALKAQTRAVEQVVAALALDGVSIEGSDSLDNPNAVFQ